MLLVSVYGDDRLGVRLEEIGAPTVLNGRPLGTDAGLLSVDADNVAGARRATEVLLARGGATVATILPGGHVQCGE